MAPSEHEVKAPETGHWAATTKVGILASQKPTLGLKKTVTKDTGRTCHKINNYIFYKISPGNL